VPLAKAKGKGNQVQNPGRSGHCKWEAVYQKATGETPGKAVSKRWSMSQETCPGIYWCGMHPPMERAVPGQEFDLTGDI